METLQILGWIYLGVMLGSLGGVIGLGLFQIFLAVLYLEHFLILYPTLHLYKYLEFFEHLPQLVLL